MADRDAHCGGCGKPLLWAVTDNAKRMPLDPEPGPEGNVAVWLDAMSNCRCRVLRKDEEPAAYETRYMPHWATCTRPPARRRKPATPSTLGRP